MTALAFSQDTAVKAAQCEPAGVGSQYVLPQYSTECVFIKDKPLVHFHVVSRPMRWILISAADTSH